MYIFRIDEAFVMKRYLCSPISFPLTCSNAPVMELEQGYFNELELAAETRLLIKSKTWRRVLIRIKMLSAGYNFITADN